MKKTSLYFKNVRFDAIKIVVRRLESGVESGGLGEGVGVDWGG